MEAIYKVCEKCGIKRNVVEAPTCVICLDKEERKIIEARKKISTNSYPTDAKWGDCLRFMMEHPRKSNR